MRTRNKLVYGVGVNDADYAVTSSLRGKRVACYFYQAWHGMLERCYDVEYREKYPTYVGCAVVPDWLTFSGFKSWMVQQDWKGNHLDKDLLVVGNKIYSPENCVFVDVMTNSFTTDSGASRGEWPLGVSFHKQSCKLQAQCNNPFTKKREYLGLFTCPNQAHQAWKKRKHELACQLAELQTDTRVAAALRVRYL